MASSDVQYPWPSAVNFANFLSAKLSFDNGSSTNYEAWEEQMLCLIEGQDLLGFIDGSILPPPETVPADSSTAMKNPNYVLWRRTDRLLKGWILGSLNENLVLQVAKLKTARDVWLELETMFRRQSENDSADTEPSNEGKDLIEYVPLHKAALQGDWEAAKRIFDRDPAAITATFGLYLITPLYIAVGTGKAIDFVQNLVDTMPDEAMEQRYEPSGDTVLHTAVMVGSKTAATILVNRMPRLLYLPNNHDEFPVETAAKYVHKKLLQYLISVTKEQTPYEGMPGLRLLKHAIDAEFFDVALSLVEKYPHLARVRFRNGDSALSAIATNKSAFSNGGRFSFWDCFLPIWPGVKSSMDKHQQARSLVKCLCEQLEHMTFEKASAIAEIAITTAARLDIRDAVEMIIEAFPNAIYSMEPVSNQFIFHVAIKNRSANVFNLIYQMSDHKYLLYSNIVDPKGNSPLHMAGKLAPPHKLNEISGAALQMQREIQWYKEVEKLVHPFSKEYLNDDDKSSIMIFDEEHRQLKEEGEKWMKSTSQSCTIAATLIAIVMFAAAITVPGGNDDNTGFPLFSKDKAFLLFAISDAISLFMSATSLLMFLSILTSRYMMEDFLHVLPKRLIIGLGSLFLSITFMMAAFSAAIYIVFGQRKSWVLVPVAAFACLPVTSFVLLQFPLLVDLISSTYGRGIFGKQSNRPFY